MQSQFEVGVVLLLIVAAVAMLSKRLHLPYSVGLVVAGVALSYLPFVPKIALTRDLIFTALLPPLLFTAAFDLRWDRLRKNLPLVILLASVGVLLSAGVTAAGMHVFLHWEWIAALAFGVLIAATDPVSVIAIFKEAKAHGRLLLLIESESLFNDGTAAVAFSVVLALAGGHQPSAANVAWLFLKEIAGGILCGFVVSYGAVLLMGRTSDHLVEVTFSTVAAYGAFLLADDFGLSGVLATITAGLVMSNCRTPSLLSERGRTAIETFWEYAGFIANSLIFLLIGMHEASQNFMIIWLSALVAIAVVLLSRAAAIYPLCFAFSRSSLRVPAKQQHALFWGGLRGALALALALSLPTDFPLRDEIIHVSFAVVAFSVIVQGLTMAPFLRAMGEISPGLPRTAAERRST